MMRMRSADDAKTLVLPGLNGSGEGHWQWHWARDKEDAVFVEQDIRPHRRHDARLGDVGSTPPNKLELA